MVQVMNTPVILPPPATDFVGVPPVVDRLRDAAYVVVAITAFVLGLIVGQLGERSPGGSRIPWPSPVSVQAHPRSLQH